MARKELPPPSFLEDLIGLLTIAVGAAAVVSFFIPGIDLDEIGLIPTTLALWKAHSFFHTRRTGKEHSTTSALRPHVEAYHKERQTRRAAATA